MPPKPRIKIPVHVFVYTIAFIPGAGYAYYWYKNAPTDEEFEQTLQKNYGQNIQNSREKHTQMSNFLQNIKDPNSDHQKKMDAVLLGGKGQQKRLYAVDETIYGTEEGAKLQLEAQQKAENDMKKKKKKRRKKKKSEVDDNVDANISTSNSVISVKQSVIGVAAVGALAATASLFLGGKRSQ